MNHSELIIAIVLTTLLIMLLVAGIVISFFVTSRQSARQRAAFAEAQLKYERELRLMEMEVSEHLMQKFAHELHDNIGQILACIHLEVENRKYGNPVMQSELKMVGTYLEEATDQLRMLSRSLNSEYVADLGLRKAIDLELRRQQKLGKFYVDWVIDEEVSSLDKNQELVAFRIFQEIIHNAIKHSRAKKLNVVVHFMPAFEMKVVDDGVGFDRNQVMSSDRASGIKNIVKRASMAGLGCVLDTAPGLGCTYTLYCESAKDQSAPLISTSNAA